MCCAVVRYEGELYPGKIINFDEETCKVSTLGCTKAPRFIVSNQKYFEVVKFGNFVY